MKRKLTDNLALKIASVLIGFLLWIVVANIDNPVISRSFTITTVGLVNEAYIDDTGKMTLRTGSTPQIRVTITGERKRISGISSDDIVLTADLQQAVSLETDPVMIPITATVSGVSASNISIYPANISVRLEDKVTSEFMVSVSSGDSTPGSGYDIGSQTVSPEKVRITGPESLMNKIDKVVASVKIDGLTRDRTEEATLTVLDKNGDTLTDLQMSNLKITNDGVVSVTTTLWRTRSDIELDVAWFGVPAEGYVVSDVSTVPATVSVAGTTEALETLREDGNAIRIEDESVDISGGSEDLEVKINISQYLPENLKLTSGSSDEILVTVSVLPDGGQKFTIPTSMIAAENRPENMQIAFDVDKIEIRVKSVDESVSLDDLDVGEIIGSIDVDGLEAGSYEILVDLILPEGYELISEVTTEITISEITTGEEAES